MAITSIGSVSDVVLRTVGYADSLDAPISLDALHEKIIGVRLSITDVSIAVDELVSRGLLVRRPDDLICRSSRVALLDTYDRQAAARADHWTAARHWGRRIGHLPLVRMVAVTGGLARGVASPNDPIDFFVATRPRRLWLTRLMIDAIARRASRAGITLRVAMLVSTRALEIPVHTLSVAYELAGMATIVGHNVAQGVRQSNDWLFDLLPNTPQGGNDTHAQPREECDARKWAERALLSPLFHPLERWYRGRSIARIMQHAGGQLGPLLLSADACRGHLIQSGSPAHTLTLPNHADLATARAQRAFEAMSPTTQK